MEITKQVASVFSDPFCYSQGPHMQNEVLGLVVGNTLFLGTKCSDDTAWGVA